MICSCQSAHRGNWKDNSLAILRYQVLHGNAGQLRTKLV
jgi:hypothetical protein